VLLVAVVLACGAAYQKLGELRDLRRHPPPGALASAGDFRLHVHCEGTGEPTVITEAGFGDFSVAWREIVPAVSRTTKVCAYDRAGFGWSDFDANSPTRERVVENLRAALDNAGIEGPYVLVGHSLGGIYVREFAHRYPDRVVGMVLVDSSHEDQLERLSDDLRSERERALPGVLSDLHRCQLVAPIGIVRAFGLHSNSLSRSIPERTRSAILATRNRTHYCRAMALAVGAFSETFVASAAPQNLGQIPLIVLSRGEPDAQPGDSAETVEAWEATWSELQAELAALSTGGEHLVVEGAGHYIQIDRAGAVVDAIEDVLARTR
jgi:pimeloyl-ACP methyl ester carboxylesterase